MTQKEKEKAEMLEDISTNDFFNAIDKNIEVKEGQAVGRIEAAADCFELGNKMVAASEKRVSVIVSSKLLYETLHNVRDDVKEVELSTDKMVLTFNNEERFTVGCWYQQENKIITQSRARWDWVKNLLKSVPEQPIVLTIYDNKVSVRFDY